MARSVTDHLPLTMDFILKGLSISKFHHLSRVLQVLISFRIRFSATCTAVLHSKGWADVGVQNSGWGNSVCLFYHRNAGYSWFLYPLCGIHVHSTLKLATAQNNKVIYLLIFVIYDNQMRWPFFTERLCLFKNFSLRWKVIAFLCKVLPVSRTTYNTKPLC